MTGEPDFYMRGGEIMVKNVKKQYSPASLILLFFVFSAAGWGWEVTYHLVEDHMFVNRGFLQGPWLPIYGTGGVLILMLLKKYFDRPVLLFFMIMGVCGVVEYTIGWMLEAVFHEKWWDYSEYVLQIQGRVCLIGLLIFGLGGLVFVYGIAPWMDRKINHMKCHTQKLLCGILIVLFAVDIVYSIWHPNQGAGITHPVMTAMKAGFQW